MSSVSLHADAGLQTTGTPAPAAKPSTRPELVPNTQHADVGVNFAGNTNGVNATSAVNAANAAENAGEQEQQDPQESLSQVADALTETMSVMKKGLEFKVDEQEGQPVVSVVDIDSGELIRQIPSEEALKLAEKMSEVAGLLMKTEA